MKNRTKIISALLIGMVALAVSAQNPIIQTKYTADPAPMVYNDTIFAGLDYLLAEMGKRDMLAVLYLNNSWEWSGGYGQYLQ